MALLAKVNAIFKILKKIMQTKKSHPVPSLIFNSLYAKVLSDKPPVGGLLEFNKFEIGSCSLQNGD